MPDSYLIEIVAKLRDEASGRIRDLQRAVDELKASAVAGDVTGDLRQGLAETADEAERAAASHRDLNRQQQEAGRTARQAETDVRRNADQHERAARTVTAHAVSHDDLAESVGGSTEEIGRMAKQLSGAEDAMKRVQQGETALKQSTDGVGDSIAKARKQGEQYLGKLNQLDQAARSHTATNSALSAGYRDVESGLKRVIKTFDAGSSEARRFSSAMDDAAKKSKNINFARSSSDVGKFVQQIGAATDSIGIKIISLSAALRGARLAGLVGLFQPIVTGLVSLAGGFFNVAAGAGQAAATIGGVFISGLGQMIPMVSVGIAALIRLRDIFQAVQAAQAAKQEAYFQPFQGLITNLQNVSQLISAEQQLANSYYTLQDAQVQVKESQMALTQARIDAIRNLQDLVLAERSAELQLKNANLSVVQAEQQLAAARAGGSQMAIQQAELGLQGAQIGQQQARLGVPRARQNLSLAQSYGVAGSPQVLAATESYRQSLLGVKQAYQGIAAAERQMKITELQLKQPASYMTQQQATLQYLLNQMSAPEKALFNVINNIESQLRSPNSPLKKISDYIIEPFTYAFQRLDALLTNKSFLGPITKLAQSMGKGLDSVFKTMFGPRGTSFFETMAKDATESIPVVVKAITGLMKVFEDIATAAAPAFKRLSGDWARFWNAMDARDRSPAGQKRLTDFFNQGAKWAEDFGKLAGAVFDLFKALGHDAAPQGMKTVTTFTEAIHDATNWVQTHGPEVTRFFSEARQGLALMGGVLFNIGKSLLQVFSLTSLSAFTQLLNQVVIPAAKILAQTLGFVVTNVMKLLNLIGPLKGIVIGLATAFLGLLVLNRFIGMVTKATDVLSGFNQAMKAFRNGDGLINKITAAWDALTGRITKGTKAMQEAKGAQEALTGVTAGTTAETSAASGAGGVTTAEAGLGGAGATGLSSLGLLGVGAAVAIPIATVAVLKALGDGQLNPSQRTTTGTGLASLLGAVSPSYAGPGGQLLSSGRGTAVLMDRGLHVARPNQQISPTNDALKQLQSGLNGVTSPLQLSTRQLQSMYDQAQRILQMPDITTKQRQGLSRLVGMLDPANVAMQKAGQMWQSTFQGINTTTGNVMQQVQQVMAQNIQAIAANLGTGTKAGAQALVATFYDAWNTVLSNTSAAVRGTAKGIDQIDKMLGGALKALGVNAPAGLTRSLAAGLATGNQQATLSTGAILAQGSLLGSGSGNIAGGLAAGGWHPSTPGGRVIVAEGGHDEVTLTTDPKYAPRQKMLLSQYIARTAQHMATGGYVNPIPGFTIGRTDMGVDANAAPGTPIGAIGNSKLTGVIPNWYQGQPLLNFQLLNGPDAGKFWYVAEQIVPITEAIGAIFKAGQMVARYAKSGTGIEIGWSGNAAGTTLAQTTGQTGTGDHSNAPAGVAFRNFLGGLAKGQITGGMGATFQQLIAPRIAGAKGAMATIGQGVLNMVTAGANQMLSRMGGTGASSLKPSLSGPVSNQVLQFMSAAGFNKIAIAGMLGNAYQESSLRPNTPGGGFWQQISNFGSGSGGTLLHQMQVMLPQIMGLKAAMNSAKTPAEAAMIFEQGFEKAGIPAMSNRIAGANQAYAQGYAVGGLLGKHVRRMGIRHLRKAVLRFADGGRAPWGGEAVPIIAHEGERINNPPQWEHIAGLAGMSGAQLDHHMGYDSGHPRQHFASGGIAMAGGSLTPAAIQMLIQMFSGAGGATMQPGQGFTSMPGLKTLSKIFTFLGGISSNLFTMDPGSLIGSFKVLSGVVQGINSALGDINKLPIKNQVAKLGTLIENFADPNNPDSTLSLLATAFQRFQTNLNSWITGLGYQTKNVNPTTIARQTAGGFAGSGFGGVSLAGPALTAGNIGETGQTRLDALGVRSSVEQTQYLQRETEATKKAISGVRSRMTVIRNSNLSAKTKKSSLSSLQSLYTELVQQQENLNNSINSQVSTTFQNETQYIQDTLSQVNDVYQTQQQQIQAKQSTAEAKGQYGSLAGPNGIDQQLINSAKAQIDALQKPLQEAKATGNADLVAQIQQQISQLQETIGQTAAQMIQDAMSAIQQGAQTDQAKVSMLQTISQTMQQSAGSTGSISTAFGVNAQALQLNQTSLQSQLGQYNTLLGQAIDSGNTGAVATITQTIDQLTAQLAQNSQALQDNTTQMIAAQSQFTQARGQFQTGTLSGLGQIVSTIGQTTGFMNVPLLQSLTQGQNNVLGGTQGQLLGQLAALGGGASGLASSLSGAVNNPMLFAQLLGGANLGGIESGQDSTWINTFESLVNNLTQNTEAIATNNQQLAQLNGQLLQPQSWSTTAWTAFRNAIFSGMGSLLPQFAGALPPGSAPTIAPVFSSPTVGPQAPTIGTLNLHHVPTPTVAPQVLGQQLAYEVSNAVG